MHFFTENPVRNAIYFRIPCDKTSVSSPKALLTAQGLAYLHSAPAFAYHGALSSDSVVLDAHLTARLSDYGPRLLRSALASVVGASVADDRDAPTVNGARESATSLLWLAPELLRRIALAEQSGNVEQILATDGEPCTQVIYKYFDYIHVLYFTFERSYIL